MAHEFPSGALPCCAFIDSGIGGLPYLQRFNEISPETQCIYIADNAHFPYGEKTASEICESLSRVVQKLLCSFSPAVIVLACNTMSVTVLQYLRKIFPAVPIVGTVPAIKKAAAVSKSKVIGLLASGNTARSPYTAGLISEFASGCKVISRVAPRLIRAIERHLVLEDEAAQVAAVEPYVRPFVDKGADAVVLGCTHFLHLRDAFRKALGPNIQVVDSLDGVTQQALRLLKGAKCEPGDLPFNPAREGAEPGCASIANYVFITGDLKGKRAETYRRCFEAYKLRWGSFF